MPSAFRLQIVHAGTGTVVQWAPGLAAEVELIDNLCRRVQAKGVGFGKSETHVLADVRDALGELLYDLKAQI